MTFEIASMPLAINAFSEKWGNEKARRLLQTELENTRERVGKLIANIPTDVPGFTVHDLTHLDALWEMAEVIAGPDVELNPAEAFVFGVSVLLHDAGMAFHSYPRGMEEICPTDDWKDAVVSASKLLGADITGYDVDDLSDQVKEYALSEFLRGRHAEKAEELATQSWETLDGGDLDYLIEHSTLRDFYGPVIGAISRSHHFDIKRVSKELSEPLGAEPEIGTWEVDRLKVALLLRCADAAHIDARRAPRLLMSFSRPRGVSRSHWLFQSRLSKPRLDHDKLVYTAGQSFGLVDVQAWHLCYQTVRMIDRELRSSAELLTSLGKSSFAALGVHGADNPVALSKYVPAVGWRPIESSIQSSDVPSLARSLGGKDLYSTWHAPLRELIQNAADAIEARVAVDKEFTIESGEIQIRIGWDQDSREVDFEISDNGIGMSERVLTGALIDFGRSYWGSVEAKDEYPGLASRFREPRGRFGIGFFSVFMWGDRVQVLSRRFRDGLDSTGVLEFAVGLAQSPVLRDAEKSERSSRFVTKVRIVSPYSTMPIDREAEVDEGEMLRQDPQNVAWEKIVRSICRLLPIDVKLMIEGNERRVSEPQWHLLAPSQFQKLIEETFPDLPPPLFKYALDAKATYDEENESEVLGRAFLIPNYSSMYSHFGRSGRLALYDKGMFVSTQGSGHVIGFATIEVTKATRETGRVKDKFWEKKSWIEDNLQRLLTRSDTLPERIGAQQTAINLGTLLTEAPIGIFNREIVSLGDFAAKLRETKSVSLKFSRRHRRDECFDLDIVSNIESIVGWNVRENRLYPLCDLKVTLASDLSFSDAVINGLFSAYPSFQEFISVIEDNLPGAGDLLWEEELQELESAYRDDVLIVSARRQSG